MKFTAINQLVKDVPYISEANARYLYDLIIKEHLTNILELGIAHGTATCYMAAALDELGDGKIVSVDLLDAREKFIPSPEMQLQNAHLESYVQVVRMQTGYDWFLHDEIKRLTTNDVCRPVYDLCIIDGPKNWTVDGLAFFLVDKLLKDNGLIIFDDYLWTYAEAGKVRAVTDGISNRSLSDAELNTPQVKDIFEYLVKQHPDYGELVLYNEQDWAIARKKKAQQKTYTVQYEYRYGDRMTTLLMALRGKVKGIIKTVR